MQYWMPAKSFSRPSHPSPYADVIYGWFLRRSATYSPSKCLAWVKKCCHVWLDQNFEPSLLTNKLWLIFMGKKQKKKFFSWKKKIKMADSKKVHFSKSPILKIFLWKFHGLVLGLVGLIDAKGINVTQPMCPSHQSILLTQGPIHENFMKKY